MRATRRPATSNPPKLEALLTLVRASSLDEKVSSPLLNETALEAAKRWVFKPAIVSGQPVLFWEPIPFRFVLHE